MNSVPPPVLNSPAAMQLAGALQDTLGKVAEREPDGAGITCAIHLMPFQVSATRPLAKPLPPMTVQARAEAHDTLSRKMWRARADQPAGMSGTCSRQVLPFHRSIRGPKLMPLPCEPTAVHAVGDEHDTEPRLPVLSPLGSAITCALHRVPFQISEYMPK